MKPLSHISQDGLTLLAGLAGLFWVAYAPAQTLEQTTAPSLRWGSVAASADFTKLVAAACQGPCGYCYQNVPIFVSSNSGVNWVQASAPLNHWSAVASSADGTKLFAAAANSQILISTDSGATWTSSSAPSNSWSSLASSADGARLVAADGGSGDGMIYTSKDSGASWRPSSAPVSQWSAVASSADGTKLVAASVAASSENVDDDMGQVFISADSGATWRASSAPSNYWSTVASSADGAGTSSGRWPWIGQSALSIQGFWNDMDRKHSPD